MHDAGGQSLCGKRIRRLPAVDRQRTCRRYRRELGEGETVDAGNCSRDVPAQKISGETARGCEDETLGVSSGKEVRQLGSELIVGLQPEYPACRRRSCC